LKTVNIWILKFTFRRFSATANQSSVANDIFPPTC